MSVASDVQARSAVAALRESARQARVAGASRLAGLIGQGIQRSLSPALHEAEARAQGLALRYLLLDLNDSASGTGALPALLRAARDEGFAGLNITYPCKQAVLPLLDELSPDAQAMGAVNTVVFDAAGRTSGHNTDGSGWRWGFERALPGADLTRVVLLGAGGAGSAIAHALAGLGCGKLIVVDPDLARANALIERIAALHPGSRLRATADAAAALAGASGLVHATPTGMDKLPGLPIHPSLLAPSMWLSEIVYFPLETALLRVARERGLRVADGGHMAVGQAIGAFECFTGLRADAVRMERQFRSLA